MTTFLVKRESFSNHENSMSEEANANGAIKRECLHHIHDQEVHCVLDD